MIYPDLSRVLKNEWDLSRKGVLEVGRDEPLWWRSDESHLPADTTTWRKPSKVSPNIHPCPKGQAVGIVLLKYCSHHPRSTREQSHQFDTDRSTTTSFMQTGASSGPRKPQSRSHTHWLQGHLNPSVNTMITFKAILKIAPSFPRISLPTIPSKSSPERQ